MSAGPAAPDPARAAVQQVVREVVAGILPALPAELIRGDRHPSELGADSVDRVEIVLTVLERLQIDRPLSDFTDLRDLDHLVSELLAARR